MQYTYMDLKNRIDEALNCQNYETVLVRIAKELIDKKILNPDKEIIDSINLLIEYLLEIKCDDPNKQEFLNTVISQLRVA